MLHATKIMRFAPLSSDTILLEDPPVNSRIWFPVLSWKKLLCMDAPDPEISPGIELKQSNGMTWSKPILQLPFTCRVQDQSATCKLCVRLASDRIYFSIHLSESSTQGLKAREAGGCLIWKRCHSRTRMLKPHQGTNTRCIFSTSSVMEL